MGLYMAGESLFRIPEFNKIDNCIKQFLVLSIFNEYEVPLFRKISGIDCEIFTSGYLESNLYRFSYMGNQQSEEELGVVIQFIPILKENSDQNKRFEIENMSQIVVNLIEVNNICNCTRITIEKCKKGWKLVNYSDCYDKPIDEILEIEGIEKNILNKVLGILNTVLSNYSTV